VVISAGAITAFTGGLLFGLSLIVAIGAQNAFVLRQGMLRRHVATVVAICSVSDALLIGVGVGGAGAALTGRPGLLGTVRGLGAALLFAYAVLAARRAIRPPALTAGQRPASTWARAVGACLVFTWLNPAVYLDTVVLLGSVANDAPGRQWWFGGGAALGSVVWFTALGFGARLLSPALRHPAAWRVIDGLVAAIMVLTGVRVLRGG
jgi:L-lysine exporter family protein LysE/ArgO